MRTSGVVPSGDVGGAGRAVAERIYYAGGKAIIPMAVADSKPVLCGQFTVRETVAVWISDPEVPVTVTL
jgi:hypothetical protein